MCVQVYRTERLSLADVGGINEGWKKLAGAGETRAAFCFGFVAAMNASDKWAGRERKRSPGLLRPPSATRQSHDPLCGMSAGLLFKLCGLPA